MAVPVPSKPAGPRLVALDQRNAVRQDGPSISSSNTRTTSADARKRVERAGSHFERDVRHRHVSMDEAVARLKRGQDSRGCAIDVAALSGERDRVG